MIKKKTKKIPAKKTSSFKRCDPIKGKELVKAARDPKKQEEKLFELQNEVSNNPEIMDSKNIFGKKIHDQVVEKTINDLNLPKFNMGDFDLIELEKKLDVIEGKDKEVKQTQDERFASLENDIIMATEKFLLARRELAKTKAKLETAYSSSPFSDSVTTISSL